MPKGSRLAWHPVELWWIERNAALPRRELHARFVATFGRQDVSFTNLNALCKRRGWLTGRTGRFEPGQESWNKGKPMPSHPNSRKTQFRKGNRPHTMKYLGHERVSKDGYVEISIAETNPHTGFERRYVLKHRHLWEQAHGPLPEGMCLKCLDGDTTNCDPANWEAIPRALLPRLNGRFGRNYDTAPEELKPAIMATAKLAHAAGEARKRRDGE